MLPLGVGRVPGQRAVVVPIRRGPSGRRLGGALRTPAPGQGLLFCALTAGGCARIAATTAPALAGAGHILFGRGLADPPHGRTEHSLNVLELPEIVGGDERQGAAFPAG